MRPLVVESIAEINLAQRSPPLASLPGRFHTDRAAGRCLDRLRFDLADDPRQRVKPVAQTSDGARARVLATTCVRFAVRICMPLAGPQH